MPDDELFRLAARGELRRRDNLRGPGPADAPRSEGRAPWPRTSPASGCRRASSRTSRPTRSCSPTSTSRSGRRCSRRRSSSAESIRDEDRSVLEFLDADYTFVNERLARHYGIPGVTGDGFRRVSLAGTPRGGVLTQASVLTVTSNPTRTSPVKRGKWILENILGMPPSPPPSGVEALKEERSAGDLGHAPRSGWSSTGATRPVPRATAGWTRSASAWRTSTPSAAGGPHDGEQPIDAVRDSCPAAERSRVRPSCGPRSGRAGMRSPAASPRRCSPTPWAAASTEPTAAPSTRSSPGWPATDTGSRPWSWPIVESEPFHDLRVPEADR